MEAVSASEDLRGGGGLDDVDAGEDVGLDDKGTSDGSTP